MNKIRKGDDVIVITGKDKDKRGTVLIRVDDERLVVEGINCVKKHTKPNPMKGQPGGIVEKEMPIHISNVAFVQPRHQEGGPCRREDARIRPQGARVQVENSEVVDA